MNELDEFDELDESNKYNEFDELDELDELDDSPTFVDPPKTYTLRNECEMCGQNKTWCLCITSPTSPT